MKSNLDPKVESALSYLPFVGWIAAIIFLVIEKDPEVRFNAAQALVFMLGVFVVAMVLAVTIVLSPLSLLVNLAGFITEVVLAYKAYQGQKVVLPLAGDWAKKALEMLAPKKTK